MYAFGCSINHQHSTSRSGSNNGQWQQHQNALKNRKVYPKINVTTENQRGVIQMGKKPTFLCKLSCRYSYARSAVLDACMCVCSKVFLRCGNEEALFGFARRKQLSFRMKQCKRPSNQPTTQPPIVCVFMRELMCLCQQWKGTSIILSRIQRMFYFINGHAHRKCGIMMMYMVMMIRAIKKELLLYDFLCGSGAYGGFSWISTKKCMRTQTICGRTKQQQQQQQQKSWYPWLFHSNFPSALSPFERGLFHICRRAPKKKEITHTHTPNLPVRSPHIHSFIHSPKTQNCLPSDRILKGNSFSTFGRLAVVLRFLAFNYVHTTQSNPFSSFRTQLILNTHCLERFARSFVRTGFQLGCWNCSVFFCCCCCCYCVFSLTSIFKLTLLDCAYFVNNNKEFIWFNWICLLFFFTHAANSEWGRRDKRRLLKLIFTENA